jgi:type I restriction enzyme M protein
MTEETGTGWSFSPGKTCLNIFRFRDESLEESDNLPGPGVLAQEIVEDFEAAREQFRGT